MTTFTNVGWSLGNSCPFNCQHCYSSPMRLGTNELDATAVVRIVQGLTELGVSGVTLGGNEPIYTNGPALKDTLLPTIVRSLAAARIRVSMVTSGPSAEHLARIDATAFSSLDMVFVSLDAPTEDRHDANRGARLFRHAMAALTIASEFGVEASVLYCATQDNFGPDDVDGVVELAARSRARLRINTLKPTGRATAERVLTKDAYIAGFSQVIHTCTTDLVDEPALRMILNMEPMHCPCGTSTFRISHPQPDGSIPITPCMYLSSRRFGDVRSDHLAGLVQDDRFNFGERSRSTPDRTSGCHAQADLAGRDIDPMVSALQQHRIKLRQPIQEDPLLRRRFGGYLCTWMGRPL